MGMAFKANASGLIGFHAKLSATCGSSDSVHGSVVEVADKKFVVAKQRLDLSSEACLFDTKGNKSIVHYVKSHSLWGLSLYELKKNSAFNALTGTQFYYEQKYAHEFKRIKVAKPHQHYFNDDTATYLVNLSHLSDKLGKLVYQNAGASLTYGKRLLGIYTDSTIGIFNGVQTMPLRQSGMDIIGGAPKHIFRLAVSMDEINKWITGVKNSSATLLSSNVIGDKHVNQWSTGGLNYIESCASGLIRPSTLSLKKEAIVLEGKLDKLNQLLLKKEKLILGSGVDPYGIGGRNKNVIHCEVSKIGSGPKDTVYFSYLGSEEALELYEIESFSHFLKLKRDGLSFFTGQGLSENLLSDQFVMAASSLAADKMDEVGPFKRAIMLSMLVASNDPALDRDRDWLPVLAQLKQILKELAYIISPDQMAKFARVKKNLQLLITEMEQL
jgi:hypothetical protein